MKLGLSLNVLWRFFVKCFVKLIYRYMFFEIRSIVVWFMKLGVKAANGDFPTFKTWKNFFSLLKLYLLYYMERKVPELVINSKHLQIIKMVSKKYHNSKD